MGYANWSSAAYDSLKAKHKNKSRKAIFKANFIDPDMNPFGIDFRESRDSDAHPESLPIMVMLDVTGSMGMIPEILVKDKLGALMDTLIDHGVDHPQILFGAIGDQYSDRAPLQVGQFESGTDELDMWLTKFYLEGGGGGQSKESYQLAWLFAGRHTSTDSFEKRGQKGFLFTIGDEFTWDSADPATLKSLMGYANTEEIPLESLLEEARRSWEVFHIHINETGYRDNPYVINSWRDLVGERLLILDDHTALAETIATTVSMMQGAKMSDITRTFDSKTAKEVTKALAAAGSLQVTSKTSKGGVLNL